MKSSTNGAKTYGELPDKPKLNGEEIVGEKVSADYGLQDKMEAMTPQDIDKVIFGVSSLTSNGSFRSSKEIVMALS